jgi:hypothetical protein
MVAVLVPLFGCAPTAVVAKLAIEDRAVDSRLLGASVERVWPAALAALKQLRVQVTKTLRDNLGGDIDGVWPGGDVVLVRIDQAEEGQTRVRVQVGGMRNREATDRIYAGIHDNL